MSYSPLNRTALAIPASKIVQCGCAAIATGWATTGLAILITTPAIAQMVPDTSLGDESSVVTPDQWGEWQGDRIDGGAIRGSALFHSFEEFNVPTGQAAYFTNPAGIETILNRVTGQNRSDILGRLGVLGKADLFLLNPNGIVFGPDASLDVAGSFVATTADRVTFADGQFFSAVDANAPPLLTMNLTAPGLQYGAGRSGSIINAATLAVNPGESLTLTGETVVNTGSLTAPGGEVAIAAITGATHIQLDTQSRIQEITSLTDLRSSTDLDEPLIPATTPETSLETTPATTPETIAAMVASAAADLGLAVTATGEVAIAATGTAIPTKPGDTIMTGTLNAANFAIDGMGGDVVVVGDRVALADRALINATGTMDGGNVFIGGNYQGMGNLLNAQQTYIGPDVHINADAREVGNGGTVIVWADEQTSFYGNISANGGIEIGNGGFIEVSGKEHLVFRGDVTLSVVDGLPGTLLLDPENITIVNGNGGADDRQLANDQILADDAGGTFTISETQLEALDGDANVILEATNNITIENLTDDELEFQRGVGSITLSADFDRDGVGAFIMNDVGNNDGIADTILTNGRDIFITGSSLTVGNIDTSLNSTVAIALDPFPASNLDGSTPANGSSGNATFTFTVSDEIEPGEVIQDVDMEFSANHSYVGDLSATLSNPNGTTVLLFSGVGEDGVNFAGTVFDDEASVSISEAEAPFDGTFQPQESLSAFDTQNPVGTWTLTIEDSFPLDSGNLIAPGTQLLLSTDTTTVDGGDISLTATNGDIRAGDLNTSSRGGVGGDIVLNANVGNIELTNSHIVSNSVASIGSEFSTIAISAGGNLNLQGSEISVENTQDGLAGDIFITADANILIENSSLSSNGNFGRIFIGIEDNAPETVTITGSEILASNSNINGTEQAGDIEITAQDQIFIGQQSTLNSNTVGDADGGFIRLIAGNKITIDGGLSDLTAAEIDDFDGFLPTIDVSTSGNGEGGNIGLDAPTVQIRNGALLNASTAGNGAGGGILIGPIIELTEAAGSDNEDVDLDLDREVAIANRTVTLQTGAIIRANAINPEAEAEDPPTVTGNGGVIAIRASEVSLDDSEISTRVELEASGEGGDIDIEADQIRLAHEARIDAGTSGQMIPNNSASASGGEVFLTSTGGIELTGESLISVGTELNGLGGQINLTAQYISLQESSVLDASTQGDNTGGNIFITTTGSHAFETTLATGALATSTDTNTQTENFGVFLDNSTIAATVDTGSTAQGGNVEITTESLAIRNGARIEAETRGEGDAGEVVLEVSRLIDIRGSNGGFNSGIAASSETPTSGASGSILINETTPRGTLTLDQNGFLSAVTRSDRADAGNITVNVANLNLLNGGQILTASTADAEAGTITVNATNRVVIAGVGTEQETEASPFSAANNAVPTALVFDRTADAGLQQELNGGFYASRLGQQGNGNFAYFSFQVTEADSLGVFDIDNGVSDRGTGNIDTQLFLFDQQTGELLATNDDEDSAVGEQGSTSSLDAFIDFTFANPGDYVIGVGQFGSQATDSNLITGEAPTPGQTYDLRISLTNAANGQLVVAGANPNPNRGLGVGGSALVNSGLLAQATQGGNAGSITVNTPTLRLNQNGLIAVSSSNGSGVAGDIDITARTVTLQEGSAIAAETDAGGADAPADISFNNLQTLTVEDSSISSSTQRGSAGSVSINLDNPDHPANTLVVRGTNAQIAAEATAEGGLAGAVILSIRDITVSGPGAKIAATNVSSTDTDNAAIALFNVENLSILDGGQITASTETGGAGGILINLGEGGAPVETLTVRGPNSRIAAEASAEGGVAGFVILSAQDITVRGPGAEIAAANVSARVPDTASIALSDVEHLRILDGGQITASTETGIAGDVLINLVNPVTLTVDPNQRPMETLTIGGTNSRIAAEASGEGGLAGIVALSAQNVIVRGQGAGITASNISGRVPDSAGVALSDVEHLQILDGGQITTSTQTGVAGGIAINLIDPINLGVDRNLPPMETLLISGESTRIAAEATGNGGTAGQVSITVRDVTVRDGAEITASNVSGQGDNAGIRLFRVEQLNVLDGGQITASTQTGVAGDVRIRGEQGDRPVNTITVSGVGAQNQASRIAARAIGRGGTAGDVNIRVENLVVDDGAEITTSNRDFVDNSNDPSSIQLSGIRTMQVLNGGQVTAATRTGTAGNVEIIGPLDHNGLPSSSIVVDGVDAQGRRSSISAQATQDGGDAGNVIFSNIGFLSILAGAEVTASTRTGTAGDIEVNNNTTPANSILISGKGSLLAVEAQGSRNNGQTVTNSIGTLDIGVLPITSQANSQNNNGLGSAGDMLLFTRNLTVEDGGAITVSSAEGTAGNLEITANAILLDRGTLTASTAVDDPDRDSANIILNLGQYSLFPSDIHLENSLILQNESRIQANAQGTATGGNITINAPNGYVIGVNPTGPSGSDITANAGAGNGGRVNISAIALFGIEFRPALTPFNDITATSAQGQAGTVTVQTLVSDFEPSAINLQANLLDTPTLAACGSEGQNASRFRMIGRGGLPPSPGSPRTAPFLLLPWLERQATPDHINRSPNLEETDTSSSRIPPTLALDDLDSVSFRFPPSPIASPFPQCTAPYNQLPTRMNGAQ